MDRENHAIYAKRYRKQHYKRKTIAEQSFLLI